MELKLEVSSAEVADRSTDAGLIYTFYLAKLSGSLYAEIRTFEQPRAFGKGDSLFIGADWRFRKVNELDVDLGLREGLELISSAWGESYDTVEVSVTIGTETLAVSEYATAKTVRTYRIGDHNEVYSDVEEHGEGEHYVTYHGVSLDEDNALELVCALHFDVVCGDLPSAGRFYFANWWFELDAEPVADAIALPLIDCVSPSDVTVVIDGIGGDIRHEEV